MIDSHTHSKYSKHAIGTVEEVGLTAIERGVKVLTLTEHAPFPVDSYNRLLISELQQYGEEIRLTADKYKDWIKVLHGLEADYSPEHADYVSDLLSGLELDFVIGSVYTLFLTKNGSMSEI